jgi:predicted enzyme related to lactoylglutathione lyase
MGNPVVFFEITGNDSAGLRRFYGELFGWEFGDRVAIIPVKQGNETTHGASPRSVGSAQRANANRARAGR